MSTPINPFTVDLRHAFRPMCQCESCTRTRIFAMKGGDRLVMHLDRMNQITRHARAAAASFVKQTEAENRTLRFINEIIAAAGVLHISH